MSMKSWKEEFYPVRAMDIKTMAEAVEHSLRKWEGLRTENLEKHELHAMDSTINFYGEPGDIDVFHVDNSTCALCRIVKDCCDKCPLAEVRDWTQCDDAMDHEEAAPYKEWTSEHDPEPMIAWLERTKKLVSERDGNR